MPEDYSCITVQTIIYDAILAVIAGIVASLLTTFLLKCHEKRKAKKILLKNFRFMECIEESHMFARFFLTSAKPVLQYFGGIKWFHFPGKVDFKKENDFWKDEKCQKDIFDFLKHNKRDVNTIIGVITSEKNSVLYETINKSLGVSFNQDLCNISDNLKSRSYNFIGNDLRLNIDKLLESKNISLMYYTLFDVFAYISYLFDLYAFLGIEDKLNHNFDTGLELVKKKYSKKQ